MRRSEKKHFVPVLTFSCFYSVCSSISLGRCFMLVVLTFWNVRYYFLWADQGYNGLAFCFWQTCCWLCAGEGADGAVEGSSFYSAGGLFSIALALSVVCAFLFRFTQKESCLFRWLDRTFFWALNIIFTACVIVLLCALMHGPYTFRDYDAAWQTVLEKQEPNEEYVYGYCRFLLSHEKKLPEKRVATLPPKYRNWIMGDISILIEENLHDRTRLRELIKQYGGLLRPDRLDDLKKRAGL